MGSSPDVFCPQCRLFIRARVREYQQLFLDEWDEILAVTLKVRAGSDWRWLWLIS